MCSINIIIYQMQGDTRRKLLQTSIGICDISSIDRGSIIFLCDLVLLTRCSPVDHCDWEIKGQRLWSSDWRSLW